MKKYIGIYCIENLINNKKYFGQSVDLKDRLRGHKSKLKHNKHKNRHLQFAVNKYGIDNFKFYIIEECSIGCLDERERYYISLYKSNNDEFGYNVEPGGSRELKTLSNETKSKIGKALKGRKFTQEHRDKIGNASRGRKMSDEAKAKIKQNRPDMSGQKNPRAVVSVYCPELDETFWGAKEAANKYGFSSCHISSCVNGKLKHTGKHPVTGEPLSWVKVESKNC